METRRLSKHKIIDLIISKATYRRFTGDKRDGEPPAITFENFSEEAPRLAAKVLRSRLSRLSRGEVLAQAIAALDYHKMRREWIKERFARERRERQAELGRRPRLQPAILAAARHYRSLNKEAKQAWYEIKRKPFVKDGDIVAIKVDAEREFMYVQSPGGKQKRSGIKFGHWQRRYWPAAKS
jgi:hypothetical protein